MTKLKKILLFIIVMALGTVGMMGWKWYKVTTVATIDPQRGVYGMDDMEIWIDINVRLPAPMRKWACQTLRNREKVVLGGQNTMAPYGCSADFNPSKTYDTADAVIEGHLRNTEYLAGKKGADAGQTAAAKACVADALKAGATPEIREGLAADPMVSDAIIAMQRLATAAQKECLTNAGL